VSLDVGNPVAGAIGERLCRPDLVGNDVLDLTGGKRNSAAAETPEVGKTGMRADRDAAFLCEFECTGHDLRIAGMKPAGDVSRRYERQHRGIVTTPIGAVSFAKVGIEIYF